MKTYKAELLIKTKTMITYFENCETLDQAKKLYYELAMQLHPDKNSNRNTTDLFQDLQGQFEKFRPNEINQKYKNESEEHIPTDYIYVINELIKLVNEFPGITISVNGSFIWVSGNTMPVKDQIKGILRNSDGKEKYPDQMLRVGFAHKKTQWYFSPKTYRKRSGKQLSFARIQELYGHDEIKKQANVFQNQLNYVA